MYSSQLVFIENEKIVTDSITVAEVFGKRHDNVIHSIRNLDSSGDFNLLNFKEISYTDSKGRTYSKYLLTKDGLMFLVMGYRGTKAAQMKELYIEEFNRMEQFIKTDVKLDSYMIQNPIERATRWIEEEQARLQLEAKVKEQAPKVKFCDQVLQPGELLTATTLAKDYGLSAVRFNRLLHDLGIQYNQGGKWHLYNAYSDKGYVDYQTYAEGHTQMKWTQQGRMFLYQFLQERGFVPVGQDDRTRESGDVVALIL
ncbi:phage regulatory protein/antirepressor Ant [Thermoactinomyces sp. DSM 45892]|uniref:phage regulatory protein/antirepressor Ant n=1 Tax=Thermoactinomyces sp. DSM 45892 TaxID=1882753 RepID=UPI0008990F39|nr:phage regulatory protein/antirepressor Ant [Thermoactinomyces sp. DSM 45892]SDY68826.1 phage regulatory protein, rha family [Thermoactinomyces sp. DSM 45892]